MDTKKLRPDKILKISLSIAIFFVSVGAVPIYNKRLFDGEGLPKFSYPIATGFLQVSICSAVCILSNVMSHTYRRNKNWIFGPHLGYKLRHAGIPGLLFGLKYAVTNWGLQLMPTGPHLLLQATDMLWTVALARYLNHERGIPWCCLLGIFISFVGSVLIGLNYTAVSLNAPLVPLLVNLAAPLILALTVVTLRRGVRELTRPDNRLKGEISSIEFTALKLFLSSLVTLALSLALENGVTEPNSSSSSMAQTAWWVSFKELTAIGKLKVLGGSALVCVLQVNFTWLSTMTTAVTVGLVSGLKVLPQYVLNAIFNTGQLSLTTLNMSGVALVLVGSVLYAWSKYDNMLYEPEKEGLISEKGKLGKGRGYASIINA